MTPSRRDAALLVTHSGDHFTIDRVAAAVERRGLEAFRLDTDLYPTAATITLHDARGAAADRVETGAGSLDLARVRAVWMRRVWAPRLPDDADPGYRDACVKQIAAGMSAFLGVMRRARFVNDPAEERRASNKVLELRIAAEAGLETPRTIVTNDPERVRAAFREWKGAMVAKLLAPISVGMGPPDRAVYTNPVSEGDLADLESLALGPMIFQERVEKDREFRAVVVGRRVFAGSIDAARTTASGSVDWKRADASECAWKKESLPADVERRLVDLVGRLRLAFGAADLIRTPDGRHVFLEVNPAGEWGMLERDLGLPISEAIADELCSGKDPE